MNRYFKIMIFIVALFISSLCNTAALQANDSGIKKQIITQEQAAEYAAKLANEKFQKDFGISPFSPDSYPAELIDSRWHWGKIDPAGINGCSAKVEFNKDGSDENVKIAFHTDGVDMKNIMERESQKKLPETLPK